MGGGTDIANSGNWSIQGASYNAATTIDTCNGGPTNDCLHFTAGSPSYYYIFFTYNTGSVVSGTTYTYTFELFQTTSDANNYAFFTGNTGAPEYVTFTGAANTWQTISFDFTAMSSVTKLNMFAEITNTATGVTFGNFNLYKVCPTSGPN